MTKLEAFAKLDATLIQLNGSKPLGKVPTRGQKADAVLRTGGRERIPVDWLREYASRMHLALEAV